MASTARFWRELRHRYALIGTRCTRCGSYFYPPRKLCPNCRREGKIEEYHFKGNGEVVTFTIVHERSMKHPSKRLPYILAIIKLEEGVTMLSEVICDPEEIKVGMKVKAVFRKIEEDGERGIIMYGTKFVPA